MWGVGAWACRPTHMYKNGTVRRMAQDLKHQVHTHLLPSPMISSTEGLLTISLIWKGMP